MTTARSFRDDLIRLHDLRQRVLQQGHIGQLDWQHYIELVVRICRVRGGALLQDANGHLELVAATEIDNIDALSAFVQSAEFSVFRGRADQKGYAARKPNPMHPLPLDMVLLPSLVDPTVYVLLLSDDADQARHQDIVLRAQLLQDFSARQSLPTAAKPADAEPSSASAVIHLLDLLNDVYQSQHFLTACYAIANGIVSHSPEIDQVVVGWREGDYLRVKVISHYERFEKKTDTVRLFEAALEEAADQYTDIVFQADTQVQFIDLITLAHKQLQVHIASHSIVTLPLQDANGETRLVVSLIGYAEPPEKQTCEAVQFVLQTALPKLQTLYVADASLWVRLREQASQRLARWLGPENLWVKSLIFGVSVALLFSLVLTTMHRVEGQGQLVTDHTRVVSAPFDGIVTDAFFSSGDEVEAGTLMLALDTQDLMLQLSELQAELQRVMAEANRARAQFSSIDLEIANARAQQTQARIDRVNSQLARAQLYAPLTGVVVEGERRELLSAPVAMGEPLMRVAEIADLYVSIQVSHEDVHFVSAGQVGHFALVSQPNVRIPVVVTHVVPMATVSSSGSEFKVIAQIENDPQSWWRPGMTGVARLDVSRRSYFWVFTHKAWNRLRMALWW